jgi:hypothetical protein
MSTRDSSADTPRNVDFRSFFDVHRRSRLPLARLAVERQRNLCQLTQHHYSTTMVFANSQRSRRTVLVGMHSRRGRKQSTRATRAIIEIAMLKENECHRIRLEQRLYGNLEIDERHQLYVVLTMLQILVTDIILTTHWIKS